MEAMMRRHQPHRWNARCQHCRSALGRDRLYPEAVAPECAPTGQMSVAATCPDLWRLQAPGLVDAGVAGEVLGDGLRADVLAVGEFRHRVRVEPEADRKSVVEGKSGSGRVD